MPTDKVNWQQWRSWVSRGAEGLGIELDCHKIGQLEVFAKELLEAAGSVNLTSVEDPLEVAENLMLDSMVPGKFIPSWARVLDLGTGAGIPGIPLKIACPELGMTLIDSRRKRISFVKYAITRLGLENIRAVNARAQDFAGENEKFDVVVSRAVSSVKELVRLAAPLLKPGGMLIAMKGREYDKELEEAGLDNAGQGGGPKVRIEKYRLPVLAIDRVLVMIDFYS
ncbi:MAG: 16S rRNA (guanine(527)-N(7))-methyltransferase RsmG [Desulfobacterales bacterium]